MKRAGYLLLALCWVVLSAVAADTSLDREAARLLAEGNLAAALERYRQAQQQDPDPVRAGRIERIRALLELRGGREEAGMPAAAPPPEPLPAKLLVSVEVPDLSFLYRSVVAGELGVARALLADFMELEGERRAQIDRVLDRYWFFPAEEVRAYFRALNPLLYRALVLKARISAQLEGWAEAAALAEAAGHWGDEAEIRAALGRLAWYQGNLERLLEGLDALRREVEALGPPPDPAALARSRRRQFEEALGAGGAAEDSPPENLRLDDGLRVTMDLPLLRPFGYGHVRVEVTDPRLRRWADLFSVESPMFHGTDAVWLNADWFEEVPGLIPGVRVFRYDGAPAIDFYFVGDISRDFSVAFHRKTGPDDLREIARVTARRMGERPPSGEPEDPAQAYARIYAEVSGEFADYRPDDYNVKSTELEQWETYRITRLPWPLSENARIATRRVVDLTGALEGAAPGEVDRRILQAARRQAEDWESYAPGPAGLYEWLGPWPLPGDPGRWFDTGFYMVGKTDTDSPMAGITLPEWRSGDTGHGFAWLLFLVTRNRNLVVLGGMGRVSASSVARFSRLRERIGRALTELAASGLEPRDWEPERVARFDPTAIAPPAPAGKEEAETAWTPDPEAFYRLQIELLEEDLAAYRKRLEESTDPAARQALEYWILAREADLQYQKDLLQAHRTGSFRRTPTDWDRYNAELMVRQSLRQARATASAGALYLDVQRLAGMLEREGDRQAGRWGRERARKALEVERDPAKLARIRRLLQTRLMARREQKQGRALEAQALSDAALDAVERVAWGMDWAMLSVTTAASATGLPGAHYVYAGYRGITRGLSEGLETGIAQALASVHTAGAVAVSAWEGYRAGSRQGREAAWRGALAGGAGALAVIGATRVAAGALARAVKAGGERFARVRDMLLNREEREAARLMVGQYARDVRRLERLLRSGSRKEVKELLRKVREQTVAILSNPHAKNILKYGNDLVTQKAFTRFSGKIQRRVVREFLEEMRALGWSDFQVTTFRNRFSAASINMDWDLGLVEKAGMRLTRNGKPASVAQWQKEAARVFARAYRRVTGRTAAGAFAQVTSSVHPEAFPDLTILTSPEKAVWSDRIGQVIRYKFDDALHNTAGYIRKAGRYLEACRGLAKEIRAKLLPALRSRGMERPVIRRFETLARVLGEFGSGKSDLIRVSTEVRTLTGRTLEELPDLVITHLKAALQR